MIQNLLEEILLYLEEIWKHDQSSGRGTWIDYKTDEDPQPLIDKIKSVLEQINAKS